MGRTKLKSVENQQAPQPVLGGVSTNYFTSDVINYYRFGSYDNTFPNISRIAEAFAEVLPYAVGSDGVRLKKQPQVISALYNPNKQMSGVEFFETLAVLALVFPKVYVLCWHNKGGKAIAGGDITADNIYGFTFLENPKVEYDSNGVKTYKTRALGQESTWTENEVMEFSLNVNPYALLDGYSPSISAKKWANVDDYIADYQGGFFKNGAIPAGQFIITAGSVEEFNDIVKEMQMHHRGAGANNNVQYIHRPLGLSGQPLNAQIEWVPFQQPNNELSLQELFDQANKKIDMAFGVPQEVKGYVSNSNYASVEVADYIFARRVVYPKLVKMWSKFTHELNRITGGLGFAISFDYELPVLQEARKAQVDNLIKVLNEGFTLESAVEALQLPKSFLKLEMPDQPKEEEIRLDIEPLNNKEDADQVETSTKSVVEVSKKKLVKANSKIEKAVEDYTEKQIKSAEERTLFNIVKESNLLKGLLLGAIVELLEEDGKKQYNKGSKELEDKGYNTDSLIGFYVPEETKKAYDEYLGQICLSYTEETNRAINQVLERAEFEGWGKEEIKQALNDLVDLEHWRVERLARTETHRAEQMANLTAMRELAQQSGAVIWKVWNINPLTPNPCEKCIALDGQKLPLGDSFGEFPAGAGEVADAHPNCSCYLTFEIEENEPVVKVVCPNCKRHLFESSKGNCKGIKCQGCKGHFDFEIKGGVVKAVEVGKVK